MSRPLAAYIRRNPPDSRWPMKGVSDDVTADMVAVIPALAEYDCLFHTLEALAQAARNVPARVLTICVVNNREPKASASIDRENNAHTLECLQEARASGIYAPLRLAWVDASSPGRELPDHDGVGLARKIGLDHALRVLCRHNTLQCPLINLDADTLVTLDYLKRVYDFYLGDSRWGAYAYYAHVLDPREPHYPAMIAYECYLRYHELSLRWAGSPYAYPALGSIMSCTAMAYVASGGMNRRLAGEDFYFLQQLVKTGKLEPISGTCVHPSSRRSRRVPFGTGRAVDALCGEDASLGLLYHPQVYTILQQWLSTVAQRLDATEKDLLEYAGQLSPILRSYLESRGFAFAWEKIRRQHVDPAKRLRQFHVWFDGLRTIQLIHRLREEEYPDLSLEECLATLFQRLAPHPPLRALDNGSDSITRHRALLDRLRRLCAAAHG